uniref:Uncharacterized protein n=6 Tax=Aegilops tauschii subsp. strangulata TaxID=200361 RepID=A0A453HXL8_AEGTS
MGWVWRRVRWGSGAASSPARQREAGAGAGGGRWRRIPPDPVGKISGARSAVEERSQGSSQGRCGGVGGWRCQEARARISPCGWIQSTGGKEGGMGTRHGWWGEVVGDEAGPGGGSRAGKKVGGGRLCRGMRWRVGVQGRRWGWVAPGSVCGIVVMFPVRW